MEYNMEKVDKVVEQEDNKVSVEGVVFLEKVGPLVVVVVQNTVSPSLVGLWIYPDLLVFPFVSFGFLPF
jgi:hypothetical protein